jgi:hypothetical protein
MQNELIIFILAFFRIKRELSKKYGGGRQSVSNLRYFIIILVYLGLPWTTLGYLGLPWATLGYHGLPWATLGYLGLPWATLGYLRLPWAILGYLGVHWATICMVYLDLP